MERIKKKMITQKEIKEKIKEVEELMKTTELDLVTSDFYLNLFKIHNELWDLLYFKIHQEKDFLKLREEDNKKESSKNTLDVGELMSGLMGSMPNLGNIKNEDPNS